MFYHTEQRISRKAGACSRDDLCSCPLFPPLFSASLSALPQLISSLQLCMPLPHFLIHCMFPVSLSFSTSFLLSLCHPVAEPSRPHGGPDGRGHGEESEPSDDEMLSLSSQRSNASAAPQKPDPPAPMPDVPAPAEEVDLLGLDGEAISRPSPQPPSAAATTTDLLGDLFGGPPQPTSGASSAQSTPHKVVPNTASPCPSPAPTGESPSLNL